MRKSLLCVAVVVVGLCGILPAGANPWVDVNQAAFATWMEKGGRIREFYGLIGMREVDERGLHTIAIPLRGSCRKQVDDTGTSLICTAEGDAVAVPEDHFDFDPLLADASIRVGAGGYTHRVSWIGTGPHPEVTAGVSHGDARSYQVDGGLTRSARASGRVFGRRVAERSRLDLAGLGQWGSVFYVGPVGGVEVDVGSDGHVTLTRRIELD